MRQDQFVLSTMARRFSWSGAAHRSMPLRRRARTSVARYRKASLTATSFSVRGTALGFPFATATWLMVPLCILSRVWRLAPGTAGSKCGNPIAEFQQHTRLRLAQYRSREPEQRADKKTVWKERLWKP